MQEFRCIAELWNSGIPLSQPNLDDYIHVAVKPGPFSRNFADMMDEWVGDESWLKMLVMQHVQGTVLATLGKWVPAQAQLEESLLETTCTMGELLECIQRQGKLDPQVCLEGDHGFEALTQSSQQVTQQGRR